jgi:SSS family solute:Na+ symporter
MLANRLLDIVVLVLYFAVMIGAGYWGLRRARSADDYLVAGRRLGPFMYIGCLAAVVLGGASTIGGVALGYDYGISGMWLVFWIGMGVIALGILMSSRLSRLGVYTVSEMLENRYGAASRLISAIIIAAYALMIAVTSTIAIGTVFNVVLPLSSSAAILVAGGLVVAYSVAGGMWSITLTDIIQFCIMTVGIFFLLVPLSISAAGGLSGMQEALPASYFDITAIGWQTIFTYFLLFFFGLMIGQDIWQRVFTARSPAIALGQCCGRRLLPAIRLGRRSRGDRRAGDPPRPRVVGQRLRQDCYRGPACGDHGPGPGRGARRRNVHRQRRPPRQRRLRRLYRQG